MDVHATVAQPLRKPRGRPRKPPEARDEGNRRRALVRAAAQLFRHHGFAAVSTRNLAAAAGMCSGSPFYHFESKSALLYAVMQEGMEQAVRSQQAMLEHLPADAAPPVQLASLVRHHFEVLFGPDGDFIPVMLYEWRSLGAKERGSVAQLRTVYEAPWMPVLQALHASGQLRIAPRMARLFIFGALNWAVQWYRPGGPLTLDGLSEQALCLFLGPADGVVPTKNHGDC